MKTLAKYLDKNPVKEIKSALGPLSKQSNEENLSIVGHIEGKYSDNLIIATNSRRLIVACADVVGVDETSEVSTDKEAAAFLTIHIKKTAIIGEIIQRQAAEFNQSFATPLVFAIPSEANQYAVKSEAPQNMSTVTGPYATPKQTLSTKTGNGYDDPAMDNVQDWSDTD